jgi:hypothetical protein
VSTQRPAWDGAEGTSYKAGTARPGGFERQGGQIGHHHPSASARERFGAAAPIDPDDEREPTSRARLHAGDRVFDDRGALRLHVKTARCFEEGRRVGLTGQIEARGVDAIDAHVEELRQAGRGEYLRTMPAAGYDGRGNAVASERTDQGDRRSKGAWAQVTQEGHEVVILATSKSGEGVAVGRVVGIAGRKLDPARAEHRSHTIGSPSAVDVLEIVGLAKCRHTGIVFEHLVEKPLPGRLVKAGRVRQHTVEAEYNALEDGTGGGGRVVNGHGRPGCQSDAWRGGTVGRPLTSIRCDHGNPRSLVLLHLVSQ